MVFRLVVCLELLGVSPAGFMFHALAPIQGEVVVVSVAKAAGSTHTLSGRRFLVMCGGGFIAFAQSIVSVGAVSKVELMAALKAVLLKV